MRRRFKSSVICAVVMIVGYTLMVVPLRSRIWADPQHQTHPPRGPVHISMEALHAAGGVPPGWQFTLPAGEAVAGREVFITMQCYTCHTVAGETFPSYPPREVGPDLTDMGAHHPAAYFAESVINPNAVIVTGKGYTGSDGLSRMPDHNEVLTIAQLSDLVAYLMSLREPASHMHHGTTGHTQRPAEGHQHGGEGHGSHSQTK